MSGKETGERFQAMYDVLFLLFTKHDLILHIILCCDFGVIEGELWPAMHAK